MGKKFGFSGNVDFKMLDEGIYTFKILSASFDDTKDAVVISVVTQDGEKHTEFFNLVKTSGEVNDFQVKNILRLCACALDDNNIKKHPFDTDYCSQIVGKYFEAEIQHNTYNDKTKAQFNPFTYKTSYGFGGSASEDDLDNL